LYLDLKTTCSTTKVENSWRGVLNATLCDRVYQWFPPGIPVSSTNKTDRNEILLTVGLNTIPLTLSIQLKCQNRLIILQENKTNIEIKKQSFQNVRKFVYVAFCCQYWNEIQMGEHDFIYLYKCQLIGCILLPDNVYNRYYNRYPNNQAYILHISVIICHMLHLRRILNNFSNICRRSIHFHNLVSMFHS
jgi:hypothetical protein